MSQNTPQIAKNLSSANKLIKMSVAQNNSKAKKAEESKLPAKSPSLTKKSTSEKEALAEKPSSNQEIDENLKEEEEKKPIQEEKKPIQEPPKAKQPEKRPSENVKKMPIKKKIDDLEKGVTSLDKIMNKDDEATEKSQKSITPLAKTVKKKRGKNVADRQNILESHDFETFVRKADGLSFGDDEFQFKDFDYIIKNEQQEETINTGKFFGGYTNDLLEDLIKTLEWVEMKRLAEESRLAKFITTTAKNEMNFRQKIVTANLNDNSTMNALALICGNRDLFNTLCFYEAFNLENYLLRQKLGFFAFRFHKNKTEKYTVLIDDKIPCVTNTGQKHVPFFARSGDPNEFWVSLIEKAYAKLNFNYNALTKIYLRQAINEFTGLEPEILTFTKEMINEDDFWLCLDLLTKNGSLIGLISRELPEDLEEKQQIKNDKVLEKVFVLMELINYESSNKRFLKLLDPWSGMPNLAEIIPSKKIPSAPNQNYQMIEYPQALNLFNTVIFLKDFPNEWSGVKIECPLTPSYGIPNPANSAWTNSPQYQFELISNNEVQLVLRLSETKGIQENVNPQLGFMIFTLGKEDKITTMKNDKRVCNVKSVNESFVQTHLKLTKGKYTIIPFSILKQGDVYLNLEIYFNCNLYQIKFVNRTEKIIDKVTEDMEAANPRILKDVLKDGDLMKYKFSNSKLNVKDLLIPANMSQAFLKDFSGVSKNSLIQNNQKFQKLNAANENNMENTQKSNFFDPQLENMKENLITETLLGLKDEYEEEEDNNNNNNENQENEGFKEELAEVYDFNHYQMGDIGLEILLTVLLKETAIKTLKLAGNCLTDEGVVKLCYEIEKTKHLDLEELYLEENNIGNKGAEALCEFATRNPKLKKTCLENNENVNQKNLERLASILDARIPKKTPSKKKKT